ncbi:hypothetical protein [Marinifilum caeruleilacunae]|uniref:Uncharacterized protein n=1 Tax=Marinifilum caeruleilacunae TaxID=2499076 RepID=A0ABX1WVH3_9BACT|nr:hypothetical protein [Marinifilum caeruleilacunae]NOU60118.1 hypothetical protein [Marinifilum caeruleilacunae]
MIKGNQYLKIVGMFYSFLELEFAFIKVNETINGNAFYDVEYRRDEKVVSISYENIEEHLEVIVFKLLNDKMPDYEDEFKTLHLKHLNRLVLPRVSKDELHSNDQYFSKFNVKDELERNLLQRAKELRLCLRYFDQLSIK